MGGERGRERGSQERERGGGGKNQMQTAGISYLLFFRGSELEKAVNQPLTKEIIYVKTFKRGRRLLEKFIKKNEGSSSSLSGTSVNY